MVNKESILQPDTWLNKYGDYLFSLALLKVSNRETAEDLIQETFLSAYKSKDSFRSDSSEKTWLTTILKNKIIDYYRKNDVLKNVDSYISDTETSFNEHFFNATDGHWREAALPEAWQEFADARINQNEFNRIVQYCIGKMPSKLVPVFIAKFLEDEDSDKICKDFNISSSNYWVIIHRAKVLIRSCLEKNWYLA